MQNNLVKKNTLWLLISFLTPIIPLLYNDEFWRAWIYPSRTSGPAVDFHMQLAAAAETPHLQCSGHLQHSHALTPPERLEGSTSTAQFPSRNCQCIVAQMTLDIVASTVECLDKFLLHEKDGKWNPAISPSPCCGHMMAAIQWLKCVGVFLIKKKRMLGHKN